MFGKDINVLLIPGFLVEPFDKNQCVIVRCLYCIHIHLHLCKDVEPNWFGYYVISFILQSC